MQQALTVIQALKARASRVGVSGHREYHAGWHTALDLRNLLAVSECVAVSAIERKESRGGHFREDFPAKSAEFGSINIMVKQGPGGDVQLSRIPLPPLPDHLKQAIEEQEK
jgi:succinate dehydrogenase / fumarate reductase flavoprotein subunit